eukprot:5971796-Pyramimonas_sp.AAC.1
MQLESAARCRLIGGLYKPPRATPSAPREGVGDRAPAAGPHSKGAREACRGPGRPRRGSSSGAGHPKRLRIQEGPK